MEPLLSNSGTLHRRIAIAGQSNAMGKGLRSQISSTMAGDPGLVIFDSNAFERVYIWNPASGAYENLRNGVNADAQNGTTMGPEFGIAVRWMRETSRGNLYIDKAQFDGQPIANFQSGSSRIYDNSNADGVSNYWNIALNRVNAANAWLAARGIRPRNMGLLWVQGESDKGQTQAYYSGQLTTFLANRVAANMQPAGALNLLVQMYPGTSLYSAEIVAAKSAVAAANPITTKTFQMSPYFNGDNLHNSARGQVQMGYDAFELFFQKPRLVA